MAILRCLLDVPFPQAFTSRWRRLSGRHASLCFAPCDGEGWFVLAGDVDGDGMADLVQLAGNGDVWTARSTGTAFGAPFKNGITGFHHRPEGPWQTFLVNLYD